MPAVLAWQCLGRGGHGGHDQDPPRLNWPVIGGRVEQRLDGVPAESRVPKREANLGVRIKGIRHEEDRVGSCSNQVSAEIQEQEHHFEKTNVTFEYCVTRSSQRESADLRASTSFCVPSHF